MSIKLSCPSCNTAFALPALPDHRRATCPRCGDVFPIRGYTEEPGAPAPVSAPRAEPAARASRTRGEGRRMVGVVIAAMFLVLLAGLPPFVVYWRTKKPAEPPRPALTVKPPSQLTALGYLRADCNIAFAMQPGPLLAHAERTKQEPGAVLAQTGLPDFLRNTIEQLGVVLPQIDHIAGGLSLGEGEDALRLALVLVLKQPLADEDEFLKKLKAKPVAGPKSRHDVMVGKIPMMLTRAAPTVWVFGLAEPDFEAADRGGFGSGGTHLRNVKTMIANVPADAAVWLAADDDRDWTQKPILKLVGQSAEAKKWLPVLKDGRGGLVAVSFGEQPRLKVQVRTTTDATGDRVRAYFAARAAETQSAASGGSGPSAHFDAPFDATNSGKLLQRFLSDAGR